MDKDFFAFKKEEKPKNNVKPTEEKPLVRKPQPPQKPSFKEKLNKKISQVFKSSSATKTSIRVLWGIVVSVLSIAAGTYLAIICINAVRDYTGIGKPNNPIEIKLPEYATSDQVSKILGDNDVIFNPWLFRIYFTNSGLEDVFNSGDFTLNSHMSYSDIVYELQRIRVSSKTVTVSIPEGFSAEQIGKRLEENFVCSAEDFLEQYRTLQNKFDFEKHLVQDPLKFYQLEGFLYPDTHDFYVVEELEKGQDVNTTEQARVAAEKIYKNFDKKIARYYPRMQELGLSLNQTITLASIIQGEGTDLENMKMVSSVLHNRLNNSHEFPQLQADATIVYIERYVKPHIDESNYNLYQDMFDAYNTYKCFGISVGPINNPGKNAIEAALYPADTEYFFYVTNLETKEFLFAVTDEEHEANKVLAGIR